MTGTLYVSNEHQTYYVDATLGLDSNDGTQALPWQTIAKVNAATLVPGDYVRFKRGETFAGRLIPAVSGTAARPIVYSAYGTGARPIIDGSASSALYINNATYYHLRYEGIDFSGATGASVETVRCYTHDMYFDNCIFRDSAAWIGFAAWGEYGDTIYNITLNNCLAYNNGASGLFIGSSFGTYGPHDCLVEWCESYDNGQRHPVTNMDHGLYAEFGVTARYNYMHDNAYGAGLKAKDNDEDQNFPTIFYSNICTANVYGIYLESKNVKIYNNDLSENTLYGIAFDDGAPDPAPVDTGTEIMFNTIVNNGTPPAGASIILSTCVSGRTIKNNLFIQDRAVCANPVLVAVSLKILTDSAAGHTWDYNVIYTNGVTSTVYAYAAAQKTFAVWQGYTGSPDANSTFLTTVPGFVTRYTDLHPADGGNLKALGLAVTGYELDKDSNTRSDPPTPGCYEEASA